MIVSREELFRKKIRQAETNGDTYRYYIVLLTVGCRPGKLI